jgi:hypothetical protein
MSVKNCVLLFLTILLSTTLCCAQGIKTPSSSVLFERIAPYSNPSLNRNKSSVAIGTENQIGPFSEIRMFYGFGNLLLKKNKHIGFALYSMQEGPLISENRIKANYVYKLKLGREVFLKAAGQFELINISLGATPSTAGANSYTPSLDFGFNLIHKTSNLGISMNQLNNAEASPLSQLTVFKRFFDIYGLHKIDLLNRNFIDINLHSRLLQKDNNIYEGKASYIYQENYSIGIGASNYGLIASIGLVAFPLGKNNADLLLGYRHPTFNATNSSFQPFHIHLGYTFDK